MPVRGFIKPADKAAKRYSSDPKTRAAELVAEGKLGGKQPGSGRPRKKHSEAQPRKLAMTTVAEGVRENAELIASVIPDVLNDPSATKSEKMRAARLAIRFEGIDEDRRREEEGAGRRSIPADLDGADRDELISAIAAKLAANPLATKRFAALLGVGLPDPASGHGI